MISVLFDLRKMAGTSQVVRLSQWVSSNFSSPAPNIVKWEVLRRWGGENTWVETGTFLGETTSNLAKFAEIVYSLEPEKSLFLSAVKCFEKNSNVVLVGGSSEEKLFPVLDALTTEEIKDISFWLDGHYSAGVTFQGNEDTPIVFELSVIEQFLLSIAKVTIFVDDVRLFAKSSDLESHYPSLSYLVTFADAHELYWTIEHDIFIMTNRPVNLTTN
jgi:hypothetical protein